MKKRAVFLLLILLAVLLALFSCSPQRKAVRQQDWDISAVKTWKPRYAGAALIGVSGAAWGIHETAVHHPDRFPDSWNKQYWDGRISWRNKYRNHDPEQGAAFPGSTGVFAWTTDAKHLFGTIHRGTLYGGAVIISIGERRPLVHYLLDAGLSFAAFTIGFHSTYSIAF